VSDETFAVELAGRRWNLPHLPFRLIKTIQPALFKADADAGEGGLSEAQIDNLADAAFRAISYVEPSLSYDDFLGLSFSVGDLFAALPAVAQAAGLRPTKATQEASPSSGKSTSTP
jgi:hypothetical protein